MLRSDARKHPTAVLFAEYEPSASHPVKSAQAQSAAAIVAAMMIARALLPPRLDFSLCCIVRILQGPTIPPAMVAPNIRIYGVCQATILTLVFNDEKSRKAKQLFPLAISFC